MDEKKSLLNRRTFFDKTIRQLLTLGVACGILARRSKVLGSSVQAKSDKNQRKSSNPYAYDIDNLKNIDPALVTYEEIKQIKINLQTPTGVALNLQNQLFVSGDRFVVGLDSKGMELQKIDAGEDVLCIVFGPDKRLYIGLKDRVVVFNQQGYKVQEFPSMGERAYFTSMAVSTEDVFVGDAGNRVVWHFDYSGMLIGRIGEKDTKRNIPGLIVPSPYLDVAIDSDDFLWVSNSGRHGFEKYSRDGNLVTSWRKPSMRIEGFCGCCNPSHFTLLDDGSFITSEKGLVRVKIHDKNGQFRTVVAGPKQFDESTVGLDLAVDKSGRIHVLDPKRRMVRIFVKKVK